MKVLKLYDSDHSKAHEMVSILNKNIPRGVFIRTLQKLNAETVRELGFYIKAEITGFGLRITEKEWTFHYDASGSSIVLPDRQESELLQMQILLRLFLPKRWGMLRSRINWNGDNTTIGCALAAILYNYGGDVVGYMATTDEIKGA